jgi:predicted Zn-dependent protease
VARAIARDPQAPAVLREEIERLQTWVSERKDDALAWSTLALCTEAAGQKLRAIRADAEAHAARGDVVGSIERLRAGQQLARGPGTDFVEGSIIDTRLREMEALRRELQKDNKGRPLE